MKKIVTAMLITTLSALTACSAVTANQPPPTQVVYRFDDHRYLELVGFNCEGALWYTDTQRNIHSEVTSQFYRIFTKPYRHPSERYLAVTMYEGAGFFVSKDYGQTWYLARYMPGGGAKRYGASNPESDDILSFTVVNDQGFIQTQSGDLYMSSKPFDDPRMMPGGTGIDYTYEGEKHHLRPRYNGTDDNSYWGKNYTSWASVQMDSGWSTFSYETNWQNIPNKVPEVKNYRGWDHMQCNPDLGLPASGQKQ
ncbi:hypothetical protein [Serratia sp. DD3]|uniref:T6SS immunity protein Tli3 family protein n=1 Tax=Serratia sp. DD3 TaxID=1410619 RepID=UPI0004D4D40B|nr:hypothetical protein [Serratia sp. DD3]KEY56977.1 hypothetical protein SRDD_42260 [Serratia sp. DD3]